MTAARPIVVLVGPTAGGKTALSVALAQRLPGGGECICADSMQVYRGMDVGTAKATLAEQAGVPHHGLDLLEPDAEGFTVDRWLELATCWIAEIRARGRWPIVVGGTNLYVQALLFGLFEGPPPDPARRAALLAEPIESLRARLEAVDPASAARIHANDVRRTVRALEVHAATGRPISELQAQWTGTMRADAVVVGLDWPVEAINRRINARVRAMMEAGLPDEVRGLHAAGRLGRQAREALGYKQIADHLEGRCALADAVERIKILTRRYAKQQRTWLRRFRALPRAAWLQPTSIDPDQLDTIAVETVLTMASDAHREGSGQDRERASP